MTDSSGSEPSESGREGDNPSDETATENGSPAEGGPATEAGENSSQASGDSARSAEPPDDATRRHGRIENHPMTGPHNSIFHWTSARHPLRVIVNYVVIVACRICPSIRLKNWLLRRIGVTVGTGAAWGLESTPDVFWPDLITVEDHAIIGYDATILCHEFLQDEYRTGEVVVGERAMIGAGAIVLPGVEIGDGARVAANSLVTEDVPPGETVAGVPATVDDD